MANIQPVSALRNYNQVLSQVSFGNRVHLTRNGVGSVVLIDEAELEELDRLMAKELLLEKLRRSASRAEKEGWLTEEDVDRVLAEDARDPSSFPRTPQRISKNSAIDCVYSLVTIKQRNISISCDQRSAISAITRRSVLQLQHVLVLNLSFFVHFCIITMYSSHMMSKALKSSTFSMNGRISSGECFTSAAPLLTVTGS